MGLLLFAYRHQQIIAQKNSVQYRLMMLREKLQHLQQYSASIADGSVSINDLMNSPSDMVKRMSIFMQYSHQSAMADAQQKYAFMSKIPGFIPQMSNDPAQNPQLQQQYQQMVFKNLYEQSREKFSEYEKQILNQEETKISQEQAELETRLKMLEAEEKNISEAEGKEAENSAPKFA